MSSFTRYIAPIPPLLPPNTETQTTFSQVVKAIEITDGQAILEGGTLGNLNDPTLPQDAATKAYVDSHSGIPGGYTGSVQYNY